MDCNYYVCSDSIPKVQELQEFHCGKIGDQQQEEQKQQAPPQQQRDNDDDYDTEKDNDDNTNNKSLEKTSKSILSILFARDTTVKEISLPAPKPMKNTSAMLFKACCCFSISSPHHGLAVRGQRRRRHLKWIHDFSKLHALL